MNDKKPTLSLCMIVRNEEEFLSQCLESVRDVVDEMVIVDTGSGDKTVEIAESFGARVYYHPWQGSFSEARNFGLQFAKGEWIFQMDADEALEKEDIPILKKALQSDRYNAINVALLNDSPEGWSKHYFQRIFRRGKARYEGIVHNQLIFEGVELRTEIRIYHYGYNLSEDKMQAKFRRTGELLRKQIEEDSTNPFSWQNYIRLLRAQHHFIEAVNAGCKALKVCKERMTEIHRQMIAYDTAYSMMLAGQLEDAEDLCRTYLEKFPGNLDLLFTLGGVYKSQKKYLKARELFLCFIQIQKNEQSRPEHTRLIVDTYDFAHKAWGNVSDCEYELKNFVKSEEAAEKAIALRPDIIVYAIALARSRLALDRVSEAVEVFKRAEQSPYCHPQFYLKWFALCRKYPVLGDHLDPLNRGLERFPDSQDLHNCLACAVFSEDPDQSRKSWEKVIQINPDHTGARMGLVKYYARQGDQQHVENHVSLFLSKDQQDSAIKEVARICLTCGFHTQAIALLTQYIQNYPEDASVLSDIATCYAKMGRYEAALMGYRQAFHLAPDDPGIRRNLEALERIIRAETVETGK